jgi:hypothetical protein
MPPIRGRDTVLAAVGFGVAMALFTKISGVSGVEALALGAGGGAMFGRALHLMRKRLLGPLRDNIRRLSLDVDESVHFAGPANHWEGAMSSGGMLVLTNTQLRFVPHTLNVHRVPLAWNLSDVVHVEETRTLGLVPSGLRVDFADGHSELFVVQARDLWVAHLHGLRARNPSGATAALMAHVPDAANVVPRLDDARVGDDVKRR